MSFYPARLSPSPVTALLARAADLYTPNAELRGAPQLLADAAEELNATEADYNAARVLIKAHGDLWFRDPWTALARAWNDSKTADITGWTHARKVGAP